MGESEQTRKRRLVGNVLLASAAILALFALLVYTGGIPVGSEIRGVLAAVLGLAALGDVLVGFWFIRSSQSS
jgi:hypothetical protein